MVAHHYISRLLIDERVSELRDASGGGRPEEPPGTRQRRHWRPRRFALALALAGRRAIKPTSSSPS
jgi:hypothetical protein